MCVFPKRINFLLIVWLSLPLNKHERLLVVLAHRTGLCVEESYSANTLCKTIFIISVRHCSCLCQAHNLRHLRMKKASMNATNCDAPSCSRILLCKYKNRVLGHFAPLIQPRVEIMG